MTLIGTTVAAVVFFAPQRAISTAGDSLWAFFFAANWNFAIDGTDYFTQGGAVSPVQHFWSLSVEEQFYFVWPWVLLALLTAFAAGPRRASRRVRIVAAVSIATVSAVSFGWAIVQSVTSPTFAYFSTFTRAWELGLGALLAAAAPFIAPTARAARAALACTGLVGIVAAVFLISPDTVWPAPWALLPTAATALVILAGVRGEVPLAGLLTNRAIVYLGDISYSLYLWHFPIIVVSALVFPSPSPFTRAGILAVCVGVAVAAYHSVEKPLWRSPWGARERYSWREWREDHIPTAIRGGFLGTAIALTGILIATMSPASSAIAAAAPPQVQPGSAAADLQVSLERALAATEWPELTPRPELLGAGAKVDAWVEDGCLALEQGAEQEDPAKTVARCTYGPKDATQTMVLLGDSFAISWLPALEAGYPDWRIHVMTMQQCPASDVRILKSDGSQHTACDEFRAWTRERVSRLAPDLVVVSEAENTMFRLSSGLNSDPAAEEVGAGMASSLKALDDLDLNIVVLGSPPLLVSYEECFTPTSGPQACTASPIRAHWLMNDTLAEAARGTSATFVPTTPLFCVADRCPIQVDGIVERADQGHLTQEYSEHVGRALASLIETAQR